ncbi:MAG TPA: endolytic transglycosylase MltG [bacterium]|nr:endolytic transglycosylase MltG [bacterium]
MKRTLIIFALVISILLVVTGGIWEFRKKITSPGANKDPILIQIKKGDTIAQVSSDLRANKVFNDERFFLWVFRWRGAVLKTGYYEIPANASVLQVVDLINSGKIKLLKITIPEGWRVEQIGARLAENKIVDYSEFVKAAKGQEGKLFPDTYFLNPKESASDIVKIMTENYSSRVQGLIVSSDNLVLASIVEREAANDSDRPVIAAIYLNRLKRGMKLEADPTVQYGKDNNNIKSLSAANQLEYKYWRSITLTDYQSVISEYNTYRIAGLPATPICNPGLKSIEAVLNPDKNDYIYFLHHDGKIYPSKTEAEHNTNRVKILGAKID